MSKRVWIIGSKRYGNSDEVQWDVDWWGKRTDPEDPDTAPAYVKSFKSCNAAMKYAEKVASLPDNDWGVANVQKYRLEQIEGDVYDWEAVGDMDQVVAKESTQ